MMQRSELQSSTMCCHHRPVIKPEK